MRFEDYMTMHEAAAKLGVQRGALYYAIGQGKLHPVKQFGRTLLLREEVDAYRPAGYLDRRPTTNKRKTAHASARTK